MIKPFAQEKWIYVCAMIGSILLSLSVFANDRVLNPDGICYLLSAKAIGESGLHSAMQLCDQAHWPFYSLLIYFGSTLTHLSLFATAQVLNAIFSLISVVTFIAIIKELGGSRRILWLAAIVILFAHGMNTIRDEVIRDHGFWAFYLVSIYLFLQYFRQPGIVDALLWSTSLIVATLFRIEGSIFLLILPFAVCFRKNDSWSQRVSMFLQLNSILLLGCLAILMWFILHPEITHLGRLAEITDQVLHGFSRILERFHETKLALAQHVLTANSARDAGWVLGFVLVITYLFNVFSSLSWLYAVLLVYTLHRKVVHFTKQANVVLIAYIFVNVLITFIFFSETLFLAQRYCIALSLVLMCWIPFTLNHIIQLWPVSARHRELISLTILAMVVTSVTGLFHVGNSKAYIQSAGSWLATNVPANASLYVNDLQLMYYSQHFGSGIFAQSQQYMLADSIAQDKWKNFNYLALRINNASEASMQALLQGINLTPVQSFSNKRGDKVVIYRIS